MVKQLNHEFIMLAIIYIANDAALAPVIFYFTIQLVFFGMCFFMDQSRLQFHSDAINGSGGKPT